MVIKNNYDTIEKLYKLKDKTSIFEFLDSNSYLTDFLIDAHKQIVNIFENSVIQLNLVIDEGIESLFANIFTDLLVDEAMSKMDYLDENWFLSNMDKAKGKFNFDVEWNFN